MVRTILLALQVPGATVEDKVRTITQAEIVKLDNENYKFIFRGNGFLYKQVRNMMGTCYQDREWADACFPD